MFEKELADEDTESGIGLDTDELEALDLEADFETYPSEIPPMAVPENDNTETSQRLADAIEEETSDKPGANMSAELEELDFYIENGLIDEASDLLTELEKQFPDAEELAERRKLLS